MKKTLTTKQSPPHRHTNEPAIDALMNALLDAMCNDDSASEDRKVTAKIMREYSRIGATLSDIIDKYALDGGGDPITFNDRKKVLEHLEAVESGLKQLLTAYGLQKETT